MTSRSMWLAALAAASLFAGILLDRHILSVAPPAASAAGERKILYWWDPMIPGFKSDKPGKSPMGMDMVPVYEDAEPDGGKEPGIVRVSSAMVGNLGVRTAIVERTTLTPRIETFGTVGFDESRTSHVHVRARGWIERLHARVEGEIVAKGQLLLEFFSPELVTAAFEFIRELQRGNPNTTEIARRKLRALGVADRQIEEIQQNRQVPERIQVFAPRAGAVTQLGVAEGMFIEPDTVLMSITDLETVWLMAEVVESQAGLVRTGAPADIQVAGLPGRQWSGTVNYIYPDLRLDTRTVRVRIRVANADGALRPNMFATVRLGTVPLPEGLAVPAEALIRMGRGERVVLALGDGRFRPVPVEAGITVGDRVQIRDGVKEGDRVVTSAQFLLDSESSLSGGLARLDAGTTAARTPAAPLWTEATVNAVTISSRTVNLSHEPIPAINWPAMTMDFAIDPAVPLERLAPGQRLGIALAANPDGTYRVVEVRPGGGAK